MPAQVIEIIQRSGWFPLLILFVEPLEIAPRDGQIRRNIRGELALSPNTDQIAYLATKRITPSQQKSVDKLLNELISHGLQHILNVLRQNIVSISSIKVNCGFVRNPCCR
jgi:hypothetical protein